MTIRECYLLYFVPIALRLKTCGDAITHTPAQIAHKGNAIPHLSEVSTFLSLASLTFRGVRFN